jgi:glucose/arabinose dehydrogenase
VTRSRAVGASLVVAALGACHGERAPQRAQTRAGVVLLPAPNRVAGLTYNPPRIVARPDGVLPHGPPGTVTAAWATGLAGGRTMALAPGGEVFVAEHRAGRISVLRDADGDGVSDGDRVVWDERLRQPFGLAFHPDGWLYVGLTDRVVRYRYRPGQTRREAPPELVMPLPGGGYNQHWTRSVALSPDGAQVFASVGSETNNDVESDQRRAAVLVASSEGAGARVFASGLRNPVWIAFHPDTRRLFAVVNERDGLGDDLVSDYLTEVREGAFYGWPYSYFGAHVDPRHEGERPDLVRSAVVPDLALGAHVAAVGLLFPVRGRLGVPRGDALVSLHGSWNRSQRVGYKVVRVRFTDGRPTSPVEDFVTGWHLPDDRVWGRPVGLLELPDGSLLVADDEAHTLWRVAPTGSPPAG